MADFSIDGGITRPTGDNATGIVGLQADNILESPKKTVDETYTSCIQQYLAVHLVDNATFYAERLVAISKSDDSIFLLALCYYRQQKPQRVKYILQNHSCDNSPALLYLLATVAFELEDYLTAEEALLRQARKDFRKTECEDIDQYILSTSPCPIPNGAAGIHLLAKICSRSNRKIRAIQYYKMSLKLDPLLWKSFEELCHMGVDDMEPNVIFGVNVVLENVPTNEAKKSIPAENVSGVLTPSFSLNKFSESNPISGGGLQPSITAATPASFSLQRTYPFGSTTGRFDSDEGSIGTPNLTPIPNENSFALANQSSRAVQRARKVAFREYYEPSPELRTASRTKPRSLFWSGLSPSEDASLTNKSLFHSSKKKGTKGLSADYSCRKDPLPFSIPSTSPILTANIPNTNLATSEEDGVQKILEMLCLLGAAQINLGQFRSEKAISLYQSLPEEHYHTGWVLHQVGKAYFAMADYQNAIRILKVMEELEPHRMAGLEVLSTALWQTKREVELSHLAQRVTEFDRLSAETWCVVGNCFSLQKDHETAIAFFRRSNQLDSFFTYSHTLSGHEYFANEDFDKAIVCFRSAIRADERHYNAWYGLGAVYYRQEKFDLAEYHFRRACCINPQSSVLICHLGMAQNANGKPYEALDTLQAAFSLDPHNPQAHYQRALVYQALDRNEDALAELEKVRDAAPREAQIHFSMGRLYKRMGRTDKAMRCFLDALDLDPKDTNLIKAALDKMDEPDLEEEISAF